MPWTINFAETVGRQLKKLDKEQKQRILAFLYERLTHMENPRSLGEALKGSSYKGLWKYRVGDYRLICNIQDKEIAILVVKVGNRRDVYRP